MREENEFADVTLVEQHEERIQEEERSVRGNKKYLADVTLVYEES